MTMLITNFIWFVCASCRYYHNEKDIDDDDDDDNDQRSSMENVENNIEIPEINLNNNEDFTEESVLDLDIPSSGLDETDIETSNRESSEEKSRANVLTEINIEAKNNRNIEKIVTTPISTTSTATIPSLTASPSTETELTEPKPGCSTDTTPSIPSNSIEDNTSNITINTAIQKPRKSIGSSHQVKMSQNVIGKSKINLPETAGTSSIDAFKVKKPMQRTAMISNQTSFGPAQSLSSRDCCSDGVGRYANPTIGSARKGKKKESTLLHGSKLNTGNNATTTTTTVTTRINRKMSKTESDAMPITPTSACLSTRSVKRSILRTKNPSTGIAAGSAATNSAIANAAATTNLNISSDFCKDPSRTNNEQSNMFLYIDLHGHASKKGIFMYGNYLPNIAESVECMLLPRLMSMNSHHFHFDACVFSERNMYHKYDFFSFLFCIHRT